MRKRLILWFVTFVLAVLSTSCGSDFFQPPEAKPLYTPPRPQNFSNVEFHLLTVGFGSEVYMAFGHSLVRMIDRDNNIDIVYNWGVFDFTDPTFLPAFVYGVNWYRLDAYHMRTVRRIYQHEKRSLVQEKINLTNKQKEILYDRIVWNSKPENLFYRYHFYLDNCSTKVRDYIDEALGGPLAKRYKETIGEENLRDSIRHYFGQPFPMLELFVEILMNSDLEEDMTQWREMYLPHFLRARLLELPQIDDDGNPLEQTKLLTDKIQIFDYPSPLGKSPLNGFQILFFIFLVPFLWPGFLFLLTDKTKMAYRMLGLSCIIWGLFAGFYGIAMPNIWIFFQHIHGLHPANMWIFWPTDILLVGLGYQWLRHADRLECNTLPRKLVRWTSLLHLLTIPLFILLYITGIIKQDVSNVLAYLSPLAILICSLVWRYGFIRK